MMSASVKTRRWHLAAEFLLLFVALPTGAWALRRFGAVPVPVIPALWILTGICLAILLADPTFDRRRLYRFAGVGRAAPGIVLRFAVLAGALWAAVAVLAPELLWGFPRHRPALWAIVMVAYPVLSVYPQGIVYRAFVFHRYRSLAPSRWGMILTSAAAFSFSHVVFGNLPAMGLTLAGGILFAWTYARTDSLPASWMEHSLYGDFAFTVGLGVFLYHGTVELVQRAFGG